MNVRPDDTFGRFLDFFLQMIERDPFRLAYLMICMGFLLLFFMVRKNRAQDITIFGLSPRDSLFLLVLGSSLFAFMFASLVSSVRLEVDWAREADIYFESPLSEFWDARLALSESLVLNFATEVLGVALTIGFIEKFLVDGDERQELLVQVKELNARLKELEEKSAEE